jgi:adenine-specific DNA-methyltransferase
MQTKLSFSIPKPIMDERPTEYADRVGGWYVAQRNDAQRKEMGLYLTPVVVADFMASMLGETRDNLRLLDPAAGTGILLCAAVEHLAKEAKPPCEIDLTAYELDEGLIEPLRAVLRHLKAWASKRGIAVKTTVRHEDFILTKAGALRGDDPEYFDAVIANPPYFKITKNDPRALAAQSVVHGQPNIYGLFMAVAASLLSDIGDFVFITPRSFASGPYFRRFRERFFQVARPCRVHLFASRRIAFSRDDVLQENIILHAVRDNGWSHRKGTPPRMVISTSAGLSDMDLADKRAMLVREVLDLDAADKVLRLPGSSAEERLLRRVEAWPGSLQAYGLQISTGPVVPFRATKWLTEKSNGVTVPLLWMNHVRAMDVHWPNGVRKPQYILSKEGSRNLLLHNRNYVVLRRFSAKEEKRRLTAAPLLARDFDASLIGLENHLNYIHRPGGTLTEDETWGLAALLNSALLDGYFRCVNGNTQVSATELRAMPLPPLETIVAIGKRARKAHEPMNMIDDLVDELVGFASGAAVYEGERAVG